MSGDAKYISLYYSLVHQGASDFYKEIIKGPGGNMSYIPPWAPGSGGGHYPPHMLPPHPSTSASSASHSSQTTHSTTQSNSSPSVYQNLSPVVKSVPPPSVSIIQSSTTSKPTTVSSSAAASTPTTTSSSTSSLSIDDPYEPQGFQRSESPPIKRPNLGEPLKSENHSTSHRDSPVPEMLLGLAGPSSIDLKTGMRKTTGKYPAPEQLPGPVMFSYQGRGRPRKNWTHATGLPTMLPVTHPPINHGGTPEDPDDEENRPFKCNLCGKGFKLKGGLVQHERTHSTDRPYVCPDCGKLFRQPTHLQQHIRIHTGEKPYDCAFCDKSFRQRTILNQHLRIHTGEKPYACMECGKQFRQKAILDQHFRTHLGDKPYACPHPSCRKHFREMATLISHMKCHKDVPDPRIVLQQAKQLIKEERQEIQIIREHGEGPDRGHGQEGVGQDRLGQDIGMGPSRVGQDSLGQDRVNQDRSHGQRESGSGNSEPGGYQGSDQIRHNHRPFPPPNSSDTNVAQKSPHPLSQHSGGGDQSNESPTGPSAPHSQSLPTNMMPTPPQMAMANLIPYPHSIFPATSYMMPQPDPRQYHPQPQQQHRPNQ